MNLRSNLPFPRTPRCRARQSFTLVEMLVAMAIMSILLLVIFGAFAAVAAIYQKTDARTDSFRDARASLHLMASELDTLVDASSLSNNPTATNAPTINAPTLPRIEIGTPPNTYLAFLARVPQQEQPTNEASDLCIVGYFLATNTTDPNVPMALYRVLVPGDDTYTRLSSGSTNLLEASDMTVANPNAEPVANDVTSFTIEGLDPSLNVLPNPSTATNLTYVQVSLSVIGQGNAAAYFATNAPAGLKTHIQNTDARSFTLRSYLKSSSN